MIVEGSVTVVSSTYLTIGTAVAPPPYADMIIYQNLVQQSSGDVTINRNGRLAVFGNITDSGGGGTFIQVNNGGQAYVHGNITYSGGGSSIQNNNTTSPYGLYVNGTATSSGEWIVHKHGRPADHARYKPRLLPGWHRSQTARCR